MVSNSESVHIFSGGNNDANELVAYTEWFHACGVVGFANLVSVVDVQVASTDAAVADLENDGMVKFE
jgi:hypothetical protein